MRIGLWLHGTAFAASLTLFVWLLLAPSHRLVFATLCVRFVMSIATVIARLVMQVAAIVTALLYRSVFVPMLRNLFHAHH